MRRLLGALAITSAALVSAGALCAQPKPVLGFGGNASGWYWWGPKTVYPGFTTYYNFAAPAYRIPVTCSASGNTCNVSGSGYTLTGTETNVVIEATTVPTGLETMLESFPAIYDLCNEVSTTFQFCHHGTSTVETFSSTGSGVNIVFMPAAKVGQHSFFIASNRASDMGFPTGTTVTWGVVDGSNGQDFSSGFTSNNGYPYSYGSAYVQALKADIPSNASAGDHTITITVCDAEPLAGVHACPAGSNSSTLTFTATVKALTYLSDANESTSFPSIPGLTKWVSYMTVGDGLFAGGWGDQWCNRTTGALNPIDISTVFNADNSIFYYDGGANFHRISQWLGDSGSEKCSQNLLQQSGFTNANTVADPVSGNYLGDFWINGTPPGYRIFPIGFANSVNQDARYIGVVQDIAATLIPGKGDGTVRAGCYISDSGIRESAYALISMLAIDKMGLTPQDPTWHVREQRCADVLVGHINEHLDGTGRYTFIEYFFDGIAMDALIKWWQKTKDPRVPMVVKLDLDKYYSDYNLTTHIAMFNPDPNGIHCAASATWFTGPFDDNCQNNTNRANTVLHNLYDHAFAWYWRVSGNSTYQTEGDEVFSHAFDGQDDSKGKTWSQLYRYSFNYVGWRQGWLSPEKSVQ